VNIPRYWAKETKQETAPNGKIFALQCWRWSDHSLEDAKREAQRAVDQIAGKVRRSERLDRYSYGKRPLREEIIDFIANRNGERLAIITRNGYGALILNTAQVMFVDIDFVEESFMERLMTNLRRSFGLPTQTQEQMHLQNIEAWAKQNAQRGIRVYRTRAGLRCMITDDLFDPGQVSSMGILENLACDPLYMKLCRNQASFRARLSPKPWRCGVPKPPSRYPWEDPGEERVYRKWEKGYSKISSQYATCRLIGSFGNPWIHPDVEWVQSVHDQHTCSEVNRILA
jgi:hypothetical protein